MYEELVTDELAAALADVTQRRQVLRTPAKVDATATLLARVVARDLERVLDEMKGADANARRLELANRVLETVARGSKARATCVRSPAELLQAVYAEALPPRPSNGLATSMLLTRARDEPQLAHELSAEIESADRIDVIVAFITIDGIRSLLSALDRFSLRPGASMRVLTTVYGGITGVGALDVLAGRPRTEVKVSFDTRRTRLHAKAWLFHRNTGLHAAYVGSANLTQTALASGQEWMVKATSSDLPDVVNKFAGTFEGLWNDDEFKPYRIGDSEIRSRVERAAESARTDSSAQLLVALRPYEYQAAVLDRLVAERELHGRWRNLVVAATGTGKTVIAALDYASWAERTRTLPRLLFVAHRREILEQAQATFQHALQVGGFGELWVDGARPKEWNHVFASVQSASEAEQLLRLGADHFRYVVVDECHHVPAASYQKLLATLTPEILLGLTATPERSDGRSLLPDFCNAVAAELRLWHALDRHLLVPFEYFGINDGIDLSRVKWSRTGYDANELAEVYRREPERMRLVVGELARRVSDLRQVRALAFCASVDHARFTAEALTAHGVPAIALDGDSPRETRESAPTRLRAGEINVVCTCDLYNEGVDLPFVDTLLLLRPTQSATVMLQQLGRGLRLYAGKRACLVLDFIGQHRREFRYDTMLTAITGIGKAELRRAVETGFPWLPAGCVLQLDPIARDQVLDSLKRYASTAQRMAEEVSELAKQEDGVLGLRRYLEATGRELEEVYRKDRSWSTIRRAAGLISPLPENAEDPTVRFGRLLHVDDPSRLRAWRDGVTAAAVPHDELRLTMLGAELRERGTVRAADDVIGYLSQDPRAAEDLVELTEILHDRIGIVDEVYPREGWPLALHRHYSRREILVAVGYLRLGSKIHTPPMGILKLTDDGPRGGEELLFVTLDKSDHSFHASTRYKDYAVSHSLFHWQTQSDLDRQALVARRYLDNPDNGWRFHLFVRLHTDARFAYLGPVVHVSDEGSKPIAITWRLTTPMPAGLFERFASLAQG